MTGFFREEKNKKRKSKSYGKFPLKFRFCIGKINKRKSFELCKRAKFLKSAKNYKKSIYKNKLGW